MAESKYYINETGLGTLLEEVSSKIVGATSSTILVTTTETEQNGETVVTKTVTNPNNFATVGSVVDFLENRAKLLINQQLGEIQNNLYSVDNNVIEYNGEEQIRVNLNLATELDIEGLDDPDNLLKYIDLNALAIYKQGEREYIDNQDVLTQLENDKINLHDTLVITPGEYLSGIPYPTKVKVNIDNDTISFKNVAGTFTAVEANAYNLEHIGENGFVQVQEGDPKPADYRLAVNDSALILYVGNNAIDVSQPSNGLKTVSLIIKNGEEVLSQDANGLSSYIKVKALTANEISSLNDVNVKEAYKLVGTGNTDISNSDIIKIYKDSSLLSVSLLHSTSNSKPTYSKNNNDEWVWTDIANNLLTESNLALCFAYELSNGNIEILDVPVGAFLRETEFAKGLQWNLSTGKVEGVIDPTSEAFLTVETNGFKLSGVQNAIDSASSDIQNIIDNAVDDLEDIITENEEITAAALNDLESRKANSADLSAVALSGSYDDLLDKPTIPSIPLTGLNSIASLFPTPNP